MFSEHGERVGPGPDHTPEDGVSWGRWSGAPKLGRNQQRETQQTKHEVLGGGVLFGFTACSEDFSLVSLGPRLSVPVPRLGSTRALALFALPSLVPSL